MRKKVMLSLLLVALVLGLSGCAASKAEETSSSKTESEESKKDDKDKSRKDKEEDEDTEEDADADTEEKDDARKSKKSSGTPVLGDEDAEDYEGFEYLYGDMLMTDAKENKETGKMERTKLWAFIPKTDYAKFSGDYAYSNAMGVNFRIELNPYITYQQENYLPEENLETYLEGQYDPFYTTDYKDLVISDIEDIGDDGYRATVEYCEYDRWDDDYYTVFATYYLKELENNALVLVSVEVNEQDVTGKTTRLLSELEDFYQFEIDWDKDRARQKKEDYLATGGDNMYSTGYLVFELPEDWAEVTSGVSYDEDVYAPDGDLQFSGCYISFQREFISSDEKVNVREFVEDRESTKEMVTEALGGELTEFDVELYETCLGTAAKISYTVDAGSYIGTGEVYFIFEGYYAYTIQAVALDDATDDPFAVIADIFENGQVKDY